MSLIDPNTDYNAFVMTAYTDEGDGTLDYVMGDNGRWLQVGDVPNPLYNAAIHNVAPFNVVTDPAYVNPIIAGDSTLIERLNPYLLTRYGIERIRQIQADFQGEFTDRDVRMEPVKVTYTYPAPIVP